MKKEKITIAFASVIEALFLLLEIYFMIHAKGNFPVLLIVAICMVAVLFFLVLSIIELSQKNKEKETFVTVSVKDKKLKFTFS